VTDLVEFLRARVAEDEQVALAAPQDAWSNEYAEFQCRGGEVFDHVLRHDPARTLREAEAKLRILDAFEAKVDRRQVLGVMHDAELAKGDEYAPELVAVMGQGIAANIWARHLYWVIQVMALPYSDHEEFKDEWRP
jgi:hypothetical protein